MALSLSRRECLSICKRVVIKGRRSGRGQEDGWTGRPDWLAHNRYNTPDTWLRGRAISGVRKGWSGWVDEAGWEWDTRQKKQTVPSKDLHFYKGLKWMSGPSLPPPPAHFPCPPDITVQQPACNRIVGVFFTFTILTSAVCLASACVLVMWFDAQLKHKNLGLLDINRTVSLLWCGCTAVFEEEGYL